MSDTASVVAAVAPAPVPPPSGDPAAESSPPSPVAMVEGAKPVDLDPSVRRRIEALARKEREHAKLEAEFAQSRKDAEAWKASHDRLAKFLETFDPRDAGLTAEQISEGVLPAVGRTLMDQEAKPLTRLEVEALMKDHLKHWQSEQAKQAAAERERLAKAQQEESQRRLDAGRQAFMQSVESEFEANISRFPTLSKLSAAGVAIDPATAFKIVEDHYEKNGSAMTPRQFLVKLEGISEWEDAPAAQGDAAVSPEPPRSPSGRFRRDESTAGKTKIKITPTSDYNETSAAFASPRLTAARRSR